MRVDPRTGWLEGIRHVPTPNCDERPPGSEVDLVVIHGISLPPGRYGGAGVEQLFTNALDPGEHPYYAQVCDLRVSAHLFIDRHGALTQFVPFHRRAWHAGPSCYEGRSNCNDYSIGIELEGCDDQPYEEVQYLALAAVLNALFAAFPALSRRRLAGHSTVAPERKTDPGPAFDWERLYALLPNG